jgi:hypothetical protein
MPLIYGTPKEIKTLASKPGKSFNNKILSFNSVCRINFFSFLIFSFAE